MALTNNPGGWSWTWPAAGSTGPTNPGTGIGVRDWERSVPVPPASEGTQQPLDRYAIEQAQRQGATIPTRSVWGGLGGDDYEDLWAPFPGATPGLTGPIFNMFNPNNYTGFNLERVSNYLQNWYFPQQQAMQNAYQWGSEYDEAQRRWNEEFAAQEILNQFQTALQTRQQQMAEWEQQEAARQWAEQFGWTQTTDEWSRALAQQELEQQLILQERNAQAALEQARMSALGRAEAPNAQYRRNWT